MIRQNFIKLFAIAVAVLISGQAFGQNPSKKERFVAASDELVAQEGKYWKRTPIPVPDDIVLETSGILPLPGKRLLVTTRRGEIWMIEGAYDKKPKPKFSLFASGLHTPLGIVSAPQGGYYVAQRQEVTHIEDTNDDGLADSFKTVARLPISGSYHEYAYGPVMAPNGNMRVTLNVAFGAPNQAPVPWRGWMVEITPDGQIIPIAAGLRSPAGFTVTSDGLWLYGENQGEWMGSGHVTQIDKGDFVGHRESLRWSREPGSTVSLRFEDIPDSGDPIYEVSKRIPGIKSPTVWFPHTILGISTAGIEEDLTEGEFGPFTGQFFVADQGQSKILRMTLEEVKGVWQGASYPFREGFECGIIRLTMGEGGSLFAGETARGWGSVGTKEQGLERLDWTGKVPFEIYEVKARPDGFLLKFTKPVDRTTAADPENYSISNFTYKYHSKYGSPAVDFMKCPILKVEVAEDGMSVRLAAVCLREGYVHEIKAQGVLSKEKSDNLLHDTAYYTLNQFPYGDRIIPFDSDLCVTAVSPASSSEESSFAKLNSEKPASWDGANAQTSFSLGTVPGMKFDKTLLEVSAGDRVELIFNNEDDMLHNVVICKPGTGQIVGAEALQLGVQGLEMNFIPESDDVIAHTALVSPETTETIYFKAPLEPGDYEYVCTFPGHVFSMTGILRVLP
ncbi:plastocyanin/azurin family copper-binding protein [Puniceicoccaceae bacterium K14]|nr:plastocyanin/azurin family copper-binding protein [Puniceicoccaceae bacterium K14]